MITDRKTTGLENVSAALRAIPVEMRERILKIAVREGAEPVKQAAKRNARRSVRSGALYASISVKVISLKGAKNASATALVGPSRDYFQKGGTKVGIGGDRRGSEQPARYAHLVEFGHMVRQPKKGRTIRKGNALLPAEGKLKFVAPRPFLRPALLSTRNTVPRVVAQTIERQLPAALRRFQKRA